MLDRVATDWEEDKHPRASNGQFGSGGTAHVVTTHYADDGSVSVDHVGTDEDDAQEALSDAEDEAEDTDNVAEYHAPEIEGREGEVADALHIVHGPDGAGGANVYGAHLDPGRARGQAVALSKDEWEALGPDRSELDRDESEEDEAAEAWNAEREGEDGAVLVKTDERGFIERDAGGALQWVQDGEDVEPNEDHTAEFDEHFDGMFPPDERPTYPGLDAANDHFEGEGRHEAVFRIHKHTGGGVFARDGAMRRKDTIALDRATVRTKDGDGHLHVSLTPISKANVCGYLGREIPDHQQLGLKPDRIYRMWRHPEELEKAADSFNGKPLLFGHNPVSAAAHDHDRTVGSVSGTKWQAPFLMAALDVWPSKAIDAIDSGEHEELSSAYAYDPDMTAGTTPEGEKYDGVMRNIRGNHVAMVKEGRAGKDVRVLDAALPKLKDICMNARTAVPARTTVKADSAIIGALLTGIAQAARPKLAQDAKLDLMPALKGVTAKNARAKAPAIGKAVARIAKGKLAADADLDADEVQAVVEEVADLIKSESDDIAAAVADPDPVAAPDPDAEDAPDMAALMSFLDGKLSDEDMAKVKAMCGKGDADAEDERRRRGAAAAPSGAQDKDKPPVITKPAMDAAIAQARKDAAADAMRAANAIREAERFVRPYVGEIAIACDSAEAVHRAALDVLKVKHEGKHPDALADLVEVHGQAAKAKSEPPRRHDPIAQDAAAEKGFAERVPGADRIRIL